MHATLTLIGLVTTIVVGPLLPRAGRRSRAPVLHQAVTIAVSARKMRRDNLPDI